MTMWSAGLLLGHLLAHPSQGYVAPRPLLPTTRSAFVGPAHFRRQTATRPAVHVQRHGHALFSSATDVQNATDGVDNGTGRRSDVISAPEALGASGDWAAYLDESKGLIYYFNPRTGESTWEPPEDADFSGIQSKIDASKKAEMRDKLKGYLEERLNDSSTEFVGAMHEDRRDMEWRRREAEERVAEEKSKVEKMTTEAKQKTVSAKKAGEVIVKKSLGEKEILAEWKEWQALVDDKRGQIYYFNKRSRESSWERPEGFPEPKLSASRKVALEEQSKRYSEWHDDASPEEATEEAKVLSPKAPPPDLKGATQPTSLPIVQQGDWAAYFDVKSGLVFYFNEASSKTTWDPPSNDFPRVVMEGTTPRVLDPSSSNISMERALGYTGIDEMAEALAWEEAKKKERARKAAMRAEKAKATQKDRETAEMYEAAKKTELERLEQEKKATEERELKAKEKKAKEEKLRLEKMVADAKAAKEREVARLEKQRLEANRIAAEEAKSREREDAAKLAIEEKLEQERLEKERLDEGKREAKPELKTPVPPKGKPAFTVESVETMVAPLKTNTLYEVLQCAPDASRMELKRAYLSLAKETHPDALLQYGLDASDETEQRFGEIAQAWKVLGDTQSRRRYDRELAAKGLSSKAGGVFESWVMGAAKAMDEALANAEDDLDDQSGKQP
ncbi:hypothetical protein ACHAXT_011560 [Thalassiosira profunda]